MAVPTRSQIQTFRLVAACLILFVGYHGLSKIKRANAGEFSAIGPSNTVDELQSHVDALEKQVLSVKKRLNAGWNPAEDPDALFFTGYHRTDLARALFPGVGLRCYTKKAQQSASAGDILFVGMHGPLRAPPSTGSVPGFCNGDAELFPGVVLTYNAEPCHIARPCRLSLEQRKAVRAALSTLHIVCQRTHIACHTA